MRRRSGAWTLDLPPGIPKWPTSTIHNGDFILSSGTHIVYCRLDSFLATVCSRGDATKLWQQLDTPGALCAGVFSSGSRLLAIDECGRIHAYSFITHSWVCVGRRCPCPQFRFSATHFRTLGWLMCSDLDSAMCIEVDQGKLHYSFLYNT